MQLQPNPWFRGEGAGQRAAEACGLWGWGGTRSEGWDLVCGSWGWVILVKLPCGHGHILPCAGKVLGNLQLNLLSKSKVYEDPALSAIFLHNNYNYILKALEK